MNIALIGYGKMGKAVEKIARNRNHKIVLISTCTPDLTNLKEVNIAIEFSIPEAAFKNVKICLENNIPVVCGTTGWLDKLSEIKSLCQEKNGTFLYSSNFSIGVNLFFEINRIFAHIIAPYKEYEVSIEEKHHTEKKDTPSGTAITLAKAILNEGNQLVITSQRIEHVIGIHTIRYHSTIDDISLQHRANNREGFALGAVVAAEWVSKKKGIFSMKDVLGIGE
ncbi:4-hydroxy-tetrahydrodipicolinate reductase [Candidatus Walczuchella monophlebidarum]|uniref:4-hydroxy-tetrahydrodipicolinate reductase n=1 Tax=Candidatus Walczuchella monophlebidarum TaxID=1415657 RepID=A0A068DWS1_9FLAO|nr:dihydrodipicolinate reductase C-terminal domain-containing protein [Candidatus Walczuchella monophlebidarum]AID37468.1 dihydrodipicolinate reductase [Candidatus Walczuchella monophlebidarum]